MITSQIFRKTTYILQYEQERFTGQLTVKKQGTILTTVYKCCID